MLSSTAEEPSDQRMCAKCKLLFTPRQKDDKRCVICNPKYLKPNQYDRKPK